MTDTKNKTPEPTSGSFDAGIPQTFDLLTTLTILREKLKAVGLCDEPLPQQIVTNVYKLLPAVEREIRARSKKAGVPK